MTWQSVSDIVNDAYLAPDKPKGCRDCGAVTERRTPTGLVVEHPSVECCAPAIRRQIAWRAAELDQLNKRVNERRAAVAELQRKSDSDKHAGAYYAQAVRAFDSLMERKRGAWALELEELSDEIRRLKGKLQSIEGRA